MIVTNGNTVYADDEYKYILSSENFLFRYYQNEYTLIAYVGFNDSVKLPYDINGRAYSIYGMEGVVNVTIPGNQTTLSTYAFKDSYSLKTIRIHDKVTYIPVSAFDNCKGLNRIVVDENNPYYKSVDGNLYNKDGTTLILYAAGKKDKSFVIPENVTSIGDSAFYNCDNLVNVMIANNVTSIGGTSFNDCDNLTTVIIGKSVKLIKDYAFGGYVGDVYYMGSAEEWRKINVGKGNFVKNSQISSFYYDYVPEE